MRSVRKTNLLKTNSSRYAVLRNLVTRECRSARKAYIISLCGINRPGALWRELNSLRLSNSKNRSDLPENMNNLVYINDFFVNNVPRFDHDKRELIDYYLSNRMQCNNQLIFNQVTEYDVFKIFRSIKSNASGHDGYNKQMLELCMPFLLPYVTHIVNFCLATSVFPVEWKTAQVVPLSKINNPVEFANLRPISLLPLPSKLLERAMLGQLCKFIEANNLLPDHQSGFRAGYSCTTAMLEVVDDIHSSIDRKSCTALILLDFSRAFDTVDHDLLLAILTSAGLSV